MKPETNKHKEQKLETKNQEIKNPKNENQEMENKKTEKQVKKIIPSKLEKAVAGFLYGFGKYIPKWVTPNQVTFVGAVGGVIAIIGAALSFISKYMFILVIVGVLTHLIADDLDGYVARSRNMASKSGAYFDIMVDICLTTFLVTTIGLSKYAHLEIAVFLVPVYGMIIVTAMHYILNLQEFLFPRLGPIEVHITFVIIAIGIITFGDKTIITILNKGFLFADIVLFIGIVLMYYEMIRLQIQLFRRLKNLEKNEK